MSAQLMDAREACGGSLWKRKGPFRTGDRKHECHAAHGCKVHVEESRVGLLGREMHSQRATGGGH